MNNIEIRKAYRIILIVITLILASIACQSESSSPSIVQRLTASPMTISATSTAEKTPALIQEEATQMPQITDTPTPQSYGNATVIVANCNVRSGPGTDFEVVDYAEKGDVFPVFGQSPTGDWMQIDWSKQTWISASLLEFDFDVSALPIIEDFSSLSEPTSSPSQIPTSGVMESSITEWEGVYLGMPADDVLLIHPSDEATSPPEQIGSDSDGLIVRWSYPGAYLIIARREGSCPSNAGGTDCYCYRVIEIILR